MRHEVATAPTERRRRRIEWCPVADLFVSYVSRKDKEFVRHLVDGLVGREKEAGSTGRTSLPPRSGCPKIETESTLPNDSHFVDQPRLATSGTCARELERARTQGKAIVPLAPPCSRTAPASRRSWLDATGPTSAEPRLDQSLATCVGALEDEPRLGALSHGRLIVRAQEWDAGGRDRSRLLSGSDLRACGERAGRRRAGLDPSDAASAGSTSSRSRVPTADASASSSRRSRSPSC